MIDAKEAQKIRDKSGKLSFDKRHFGVVKYVEDKIKDAARAGDSRVALEFSELLIADLDVNIIGLLKFLKNKGYTTKIDDGLLIILW